MSNGSLDCGRDSCEYVVNGESADCQPGPGSCTSAECLEAEPSGFHDQHLIEATRRIREVLASIPPDPQGRKLSFLHTRMGSLLAWVNHSTVRKEGVTAKDEDEKIAKALKLKKSAAAGASQG